MEAINQPQLPTALESLIRNFVHPEMLNKKIKECEDIHKNIQQSNFITGTQLLYNPSFTSEKKYDITKAISNGGEIISQLCFYNDQSSFEDKFNNFNMIIEMYTLFPKMSVNEYFNKYYNSFCTMFPFLYWHVNYTKYNIPEHIINGIMHNLNQNYKIKNKEYKNIMGIIKNDDIKKLIIKNSEKKKLTPKEEKNLKDAFMN